MAGLTAGLYQGFCAGGIDASSASSDSGLVGIVSLLVSAEPVFFLGRLFDDDRRAVVRRSGLNS